MYRTVHYRIVLLSMLHKIQAGWFMGAVLLECRMIRNKVSTYLKFGTQRTSTYCSICRKIDLCSPFHCLLVLCLQIQYIVMLCHRIL